MIRIIHLSDTHFGTEQPIVADALVAWARAQRPEVAIVSGDITQRARQAQFASARAFVDALAVPHTLAVPGNHDIPLFNLAARALAPYGAYRAAFGAELEPELDRPDLLVVCVNTTRPSRHKNGTVSPEQIERVSRRLRTAGSGQLRLVVTHQPLLVPRLSETGNLLRGHEQALRAWAASGADLLLGGHIHLPYVRPVSACHAGLVREAWVVQAGTAVSRRVRAGAPNSVNLIRYEAAGPPRRCVVERWDYSAGSGAFERVETARISAE